MLISCENDYHDTDVGFLLRAFAMHRTDETCCLRWRTHALLVAKAHHAPISPGNNIHNIKFALALRSLSLTF